MVYNAFYESLRPNCEIFTVKDFEFEGGGSLPELQLAVRTFGTLNDEKDNAILVTTWYAATGHEMEANYVGRTHAINPEKYFTVVIDQIGSGLSSSPHNTLPPNDMANFPAVCIGDDVKAQKKLLEQEWGITKLVLVFGGSMGGMQAYEWAVHFPDAVQRVAVLSSAARTAEYSRILPENLERAITIDGGWNGGKYQNGADVRDGLELHAKVLAGSGFSPAFYRKKRYSDTPPVMQYESQESFLQEYMVEFFGGLDPNSLICMLRKWRNANVARNFESLRQALGTVTAKVLVMPIEQDELFILEDQEADQRMIADSCLRPISTDFGHLGMYGREEEFVRKVDGYLAQLLSDKIPSN